MYDKSIEDDIRAQEIALGNPPRHDYDKGAFSAPLRIDGPALFEVRIDYAAGTYEIIPVEEG